MSGFVYIWLDRKHKRYYVGSHWGSEDDGYICSSKWMKQAYSIRPHDFKRRIIARVTTSRKDLLAEEQRWLNMIKVEELATKNSKDRSRVRYYNLQTNAGHRWHTDDSTLKIIGQKVSAAKKGKKTGPRDPSIGKRISEAKKASFRKRREETGTTFSSDHIEKLRSTHLGKKHSEKWKKEASERMREQWTSGIRSRRS